MRPNIKTKTPDSMAYGGSMSAKWVCDWIKCAFLIKEKEIAVKVQFTAQAQSQKA